MTNEMDPKDPFSTSSKVGPRVINPQLSPAQITMDIWFIHGLFGNREQTWTHDNESFWPNFLAEEFPTARVVTYGYDASVVNFSNLWAGAENSGLDNYGKDFALAVRTARAEHKEENIPAITAPIYFIGHSLGGLVVEKALVTSVGADTTLHPIAEQTAGILFMGTPHNGSHLAVWGKRLRKTFKVLIPSWVKNNNGKILDILDNKSGICQKVETDFQSEAKSGKLKHVKICCFYETKPMPGNSKEVVPESSAVIKSDPHFPISGNHREIVKFQDNKDAGYVKVAGQLREWSLAQLLRPVEVGHAPARRQKKKHNGGNVSVHGATIGSISGGKNNLSTTGVSGDYNDLRSRGNKGNIAGKMNVQQGNDDEWSTGSEKWDTESEEDDSEGEEDEVAPSAPN